MSSTETDTDIKPACYVSNMQLKCARCKRRIRTTPHVEYYRPMYPYCPWCGAPVSVEAQRLEMSKRKQDETERTEK